MPAYLPHSPRSLPQLWTSGSRLWVSPCETSKWQGSPSCSFRAPVPRLVPAMQCGLHNLLELPVACGLKSKAFSACAQSRSPERATLSHVLKPGQLEGKASVTFQRAGLPKPLRLFMSWKSRPVMYLGYMSGREGWGRAHSL